MDYRVEELAQAAGIRVDTLRFYQSRGLLPAPKKQGRTAIYGDDHLRRLQRLQRLKERGFSLALIKRVLDSPDGERDGSLLEALAEEGMGARTLSRAELAAESGIPEGLITAALASGLVEPIEVDGEERFSEADVDMARSALALSEAGFPLHELLGLAVDHARNIQDVTDRAIALFDAHVRKGRQSGDPAAITAAFRSLLPQVTKLVALHFQRTLVSRALQRLEGTGEDDALQAAVAATRDARLEVAWR